MLLKDLVYDLLLSLFTLVSLKSWRLDSVQTYGNQSNCGSIKCKVEFKQIKRGVGLSVSEQDKVLIGSNRLTLIAINALMSMLSDKSASMRTLSDC